MTLTLLKSPVPFTDTLSKGSEWSMFRTISQQQSMDIVR